MAYCTMNDIRDQLDEVKLVRLTDDESLGKVGTARVDKAIADAGEEIDGYIGSRHRLPLTPVPEVLRKFAVDIAVYNLYSRLEQVPENRANRYRNALVFLERVAMGKISLGAGDPEGNPPASDAPQVSGENPERLFGRSSLNGF